MLRMTYTNLQKLVSVTKKEEEESKLLLTVTNPEWDIAQLFKQIQLSILSAQLIKRDYMIDFCAPESLKDNFGKSSTFQEADLFEIASKTFFDYLLENEKQITTEITWAQKMINTVILVNDNIVSISTADFQLIKKIKDNVKINKNCIVKEEGRLMLLDCAE